MAAHQDPRSWDSPGKNTGVGCHFLLQCMKVESESEVAQSCLLVTPWTSAYQAPLPRGFSRQEYWSGVPLPSPLSCPVSGICYTAELRNRRMMRSKTERMDQRETDGSFREHEIQAEEFKGTVNGFYFFSLMRMFQNRSPTWAGERWESTSDEEAGTS